MAKPKKTPAHGTARPTAKPSRAAERPARAANPTPRPPVAPVMDPDPQEVFDRSVSEYESDARRETEVAPGEGVTLSDTRSASPAPTPPRHPARRPAARPTRKRNRR